MRFPIPTEMKLSFLQFIIHFVVEPEDWWTQAYGRPLIGIHPPETYSSQEIFRNLTHYDIAILAFAETYGWNLFSDLWCYYSWKHLYDCRNRYFENYYEQTQP